MQVTHLIRSLRLFGIDPLNLVAYGYGDLSRWEFLGKHYRRRSYSIDKDIWDGKSPIPYLVQVGT